MNVLLISPKVIVPGWESLCGRYTIGGGILYIAATVRQAGHNYGVNPASENNIHF